jgi:hypothetical protein
MRAFLGCGSGHKNLLAALGSDPIVSPQPTAFLSRKRHLFRPPPSGFMNPPLTSPNLIRGALV